MPTVSTATPASGSRSSARPRRPAISFSRIVKSNGEPVGINYLMRCNGEDWLVSDVYLDGTISELAMHRSEFASILRDRGVTGLIAALNTKSDLLSGIARNAS
jgi:phospholipid transport system substrate-binding protein